MDIKATIDKEAFGYRNRLLLIALGALFYAALCVYDATVKYPKQIEARDRLEAVKEEYPTDWKDHWPAVAEENGWDPTREPIKRTQGDIDTQWWQFAVVFPIGSYCLFNVLVWSRRYVGVDDEKLYAYGKVEVPFDKITRIDASRWERKGIARVYYELGSGEKSILIDDFKYERQPANAVFKQVRDAVEDEIIQGLSDADEEEPDEGDPKAS